MFIPTTTLTQGSSGEVELAYVEKTTPTTVSATTEGTADTVVSAAAIVFDGSTRVRIEFFTPLVNPALNAGALIAILLYDDSSSIGFMWTAFKDNSGTASKGVTGCTCSVFLTPSAGSHTYSIRAFRTLANGTISGGAGGAGNDFPAYIRITTA